MTCYRILEAFHQTHLANRSADELERDATLTRFVRENVGRYSVAEGYTLTAWQHGPNYFTRAAMPGWTFTASAFGLAQAENDLLTQLESAA